MRRDKEAEKYNLAYPQHPPRQSLPWILKPGDILQDPLGDFEWEVLEVVRSPIPGVEPLVYLGESIDH
jgi:hypothetical protein